MLISQTKNPDIQQKWVQTLLRAKGWCVPPILLSLCYVLTPTRIVPNYELAPNLEHIEILRVVVKENYSEVLNDRLVSDIVSYHLQLYPILAF